MCRSLVSVDWQGYLYDCDFNQMLGLPLQGFPGGRARICAICSHDLAGPRSRWPTTATAAPPARAAVAAAR
jgi:hypothetical protein